MATEYDYTIYRVTFKNGNTITMTGHCLQHCYLNSIDDTVESYVAVVGES